MRGIASGQSLVGVLMARTDAVELAITSLPTTTRTLPGESTAPDGDPASPIELGPSKAPDALVFTQREPPDRVKQIIADIVYLAPSPSMGQWPGYDPVVRRRGTPWHKSTCASASGRTSALLHDE